MSIGMDETSTKDQAVNDFSGQIKRFLPALLVVLLLLISWLAGWFEYFSLSNLIMNREELAAYASENRFVAMASYLLIYAALVAISFPGASFLTIAAGFVFGGLTAGILTVFGATAGAVIIFSIARSSFGDFLTRKAGPFVSKMVDGFNQDAFNYLLMIRLTPLFPFWVVNIVPAILNVRLLPYTIATFLGIIPGTFAYSFVGAGLGSVIEAQEAANPGCADAGTCEIDPSSLVTPQIIWAMAGLAAISILPVLIRKFWKIKPADQS
ncbi:MAG: TVP38/TMEM64 family protein [Rhizobiaceae bacterium]